jgi:hypothetical protein
MRGTLGLYQTATGGADGNAYYINGIGGQGGTASSKLTFDDATHASTLKGSSTAVGGAGGTLTGGYSWGGGAVQHLSQRRQHAGLHRDRRRQRELEAD